MNSLTTLVVWMKRNSFGVGWFGLMLACIGLFLFVTLGGTMDFLTTIDYQEFLTVVATLVLIPAIARGWQLLSAKLGTERYEAVRQRAKDIVRAAEITGLGKAGKEKKEWALQQLENELAKAGIKVDLDTLDNLIESAVLKELKA